MPRAESRFAATIHRGLWLRRAAAVIDPPAAGVVHEPAKITTRPRKPSDISRLRPPFQHRPSNTPDPTAQKRRKTAISAGRRPTAPRRARAVPDPIRAAGRRRPGRAAAPETPKVLPGRAVITVLATTIGEVAAIRQRPKYGPALSPTADPLSTGSVPEPLQNRARTTKPLTYNI
jgi:hypothetical protein